MVEETPLQTPLQTPHEAPQAQQAQQAPQAQQATQPRLSFTREYAASSPNAMRYSGPACFGGKGGFEFVLVPT